MINSLFYFVCLTRFCYCCSASRIFGCLQSNFDASSNVDCAPAPNIVTLLLLLLLLLCDANVAVSSAQCYGSLRCWVVFAFAVCAQIAFNSCRVHNDERGAITQRRKTKRQQQQTHNIDWPPRARRLSELRSLVLSSLARSLSLACIERRSLARRFVVVSIACKMQKTPSAAAATAKDCAAAAAVLLCGGC